MNSSKSNLRAFKVTKFPGGMPPDPLYLMTAPQIPLTLLINCDTVY